MKKKPFGWTLKVVSTHPFDNIGNYNMQYTNVSLLAKFCNLHAIQNKEGVKGAKFFYKKWAKIATLQRGKIYVTIFKNKSSNVT